MNVKEKIILCLDLSSEMAERDLKDNEGAYYQRLHHVKRAIRNFVNIKSHLNLKHEYALMILQDTACWLEDFTNDPIEFIERLDYLNETSDCSTADLNSIFDVIKESVKLPVCEFEPLPENTMLVDGSCQPKPIIDDVNGFVLRLIVIYGRSNCIPLFNKLGESFLKVASHPLVFIDALFIHEVANSDTITSTNEKLCELDISQKSYILNTTWILANIYSHFAQLLSHSLQRVSEHEANYNVFGSPSAATSSSKTLRTIEIAQDKTTLDTIKLEQDSEEDEDDPYKLI